MSDTLVHIQTIAQPIEVSVKVGMEIDSKGQKKPSVEIRVARHLEKKEEVSLYLDDDLRAVLVRCKDTIKKAMEV